MKTYLIAALALTSGLALGQTTTPVASQSDNLSAVRVAHQLSRSRRPATLPAGGFWVVESHPKALATVHFYADNRRELRTDTLTRKWVNPRNRTVVERLNERLAGLIDKKAGVAPVAVR